MSTDIHSLMALKDSIESQISSQAAILSANNCNMQTPLVDAEGFPRADMDIYAVRGARIRIIELRNDLKKVIDDISKVLQVIYDPAKNETSGPASDAPSASDGSPSSKPFARVDGVAPESPAAEAGLQREDLIFRFGVLTAESFQSSTSLQPLAEVVSANENRPLRVSLRRSGQEAPVTIVFTPKKWSGRGLLGCHIVPYTPPAV